MKKIVYLITLLFCFPIFVSASSCSSVEWEVLQDMANNITVTLEENVDEYGNITFNAVLAGFSNELRIVNENTATDYFSSSSNVFSEVTVPNLRLGTSYSLEIRGLRSCFSYNFRTITVNVPDYNPYYNDPICNGAKNYNLCQKWTKVDVSYDEFVSLVNKYIEENKILNDNGNGNSIQKNMFFEFYKKYYWVCMSSLIVFLGLLVFLWIKENKKNKL